MCYTVPMGDRDKRWFVLRVGLGAGAKVPEAIPSMYFPVRTIRVYNRRNRVWTSRNEPAFPGYAFAFAGHPSEVPVNHMHGVTVYGFLRNADRSYAVVHHRDMERCKEALKIPQDDVVIPLCSFVPGSNVRVIDGPFKNFVGTVISSLKSPGNVDLSIRGPRGTSPLKVRIPATDLAALDPAA